MKPQISSPSSSVTGAGRALPRSSSDRKLASSSAGSAIVKTCSKVSIVPGQERTVS